MKTQEKKSLFIFNCINLMIFSCCSLLSFYIFTTSRGRDFIESIRSIVIFSFPMAHNSCWFPEYENFNILIIYYFFLVLSITVSYLLLRFVPLPRQIKKLSSFKNVTVSVTSMALVIFMALQMVGRVYILIGLNIVFIKRPKPEIYQRFYKGLYLFSEKCHQEIEGRHVGEWSTDVDFESSAEMIHHRMMSYLLYPTISMRLDNDSPKDIIIMYKKKDPYDNIPEGYKVLFSFEKDKFIILQKKSEP